MTLAAKLGKFLPKILFNFYNLDIILLKQKLNFYLEVELINMIIYILDGKLNCLCQEMVKC